MFPRGNGPSANRAGAVRASQQMTTAVASRVLAVARRPSVLHAARIASCANAAHATRALATSAPARKEESQSFFQVRARARRCADSEAMIHGSKQAQQEAETESDVASKTGTNHHIYEIRRASAQRCAGLTGRHHSEARVHAGLPRRDVRCVARHALTAARTCTRRSARSTRIASRTRAAGRCWWATWARSVRRVGGRR